MGRRGEFPIIPTATIIDPTTANNSNPETNATTTCPATANQYSSSITDSLRNGSKSSTNVYSVTFRPRSESYLGSKK